MSGYTWCVCRDCFDITISGGADEDMLCPDCLDAGCDGFQSDCQRTDAYGAEEEF